MSKKNPKRSVTIPYNTYKPGKQLIQELEIFLEYVPPARLSRKLRNLFLEFLPVYVKDSVPNDLEELTGDLYFLLEFLDKAGEELQKHEKHFSN